jgi:23S rRNA pseudouridine955/2504/2580 synthase
MENKKEKFINFQVKFLSSDQEIRFDKYLKIFFEEKFNFKQSEIEKAIRKKFFKINDELISSSSFKIRKNMNLSINKFFYENILMQKNNDNDQMKEYIPPKNLLELIKNSIIFENDDYLVLNKPSGICVQAGSKVFHSIDKILHFINPETRVVHRLDKKTTGVLIFAKNFDFAGKISHEFQKNDLSTSKTYSLIGKLIDIKNQKFQKFLKDSVILIEEKLNTIKIGSEEIVVCDHKHGKKSSTQFNFLKSLNHENETYYEIEAKLLSGRKHQIRAHLASIGLVILGDQKYERFLKNDKEKESKYMRNFKEIFLHAKKLMIPKLNIEICAPEPEYFVKLKNP